MLQRLTMLDLNILITLCLNIGLTFSKGVTSPCHGAQNGLCGRGQHVVFTEDSQYTCVDCPLGTYLEFHSHSCETCTSHRHPHLKEMIIEQGSSTRDNIVVCKEGFFRPEGTPLKRRDECEKCSVCEDGTWEVKSCSGDEDTLCCQRGMIAGRRDGVLSCQMPHSRTPRLHGSLRKERSSNGHEHNSTDIIGDNTSGADTSSHRESEHGGEPDPAHGYSRDDYATEYRQSKVEFPVWARILVAGVAVGVFLFYLGVGIPCNACGSRDKLRALRNWAFSRDVEADAAADTKEKPPLKPKISSDPV